MHTLEAEFSQEINKRESEKYAIIIGLGLLAIGLVVLLWKLRK